MGSVIPPHMIKVTDSAVNQLRGIIAGKGMGRDYGLRLAIERGGCAGLHYEMRIDRPADDDAVVEQDGVRIFVDAKSVGFLRNATVDYSDELTDSGFKIVNPNAARSCGCGTSFEPAEAAPGAVENLASSDGTVCGEEDEGQ